MFNKNGIIALFTLGFAVSSYAHSSDSDCFKVSIPALQTGFEVSLTALALKPAASNLNYVIYNKELPAQSPEWTEKEIKPGFYGAFALGGRYIFPEGKDISLSWTHLNSHSSTSVAAPNDEYFLGPDYEIGPTGLPIRNAEGSARFKYDVINLDAGQFINIGRQVQMRFFAGLSDALLREQVNATYTGSILTGAFPGPFSTMQKVTADFFGIGPRIGMQADYLMNYGFGLRANAAISALIGSSHAKTSYTSSSAELFAVYGQTVNYQMIEDKKIAQVVPGFDTKLAAFYQYKLKNCMIMSVEGGYQAAVYINAINQYLPASLVAAAPLESGGIFVATMSHTMSNYSVQGPYLTASLRF